MLEDNRSRLWTPILLVSLITLVAFTVNMVLLNLAPALPGADYGNYLTQVNILNGNDLRGWGLRHQPVFFVLLDGFLQVFDPFTALKVAASFVFSIIAVPFFLVTKKLSGSNFGAAIATGLFVFFISVAEMVSWGGNPNFLGFAFMLFAFYFILDVMDKPTKKNLVLSGLFLSLVIGTHILVAVFTFGALMLFAVLHFVFTGNRKEKIKGNIKNVVILISTVVIFSLPYVSFYITFFRNSSNETVGIRPLDFQFGTVDPIAMWLTVSTFIAIISVGITAVYWLSTNYIKENKNRALLLCTLFFAPLLLVVTTAQPVRWLYFMPIPILLCFAIFLKNLFVDVKQAKKITIRLFTALFLVAIVMQSTTMAVQHYDEAVTFYQFIGYEEIEALNWIKDNTPANATFATSGYAVNIGGGGNSYGWWVEGYANRKCDFTGDLEFYSFQFEKDEIRSTNLIFAGTYAVDYGYIEITEGYPLGSNNPRIAVSVGDKYEEMLSINDAQNQVYYLPAGNQTMPNEDNQTMPVQAFYAENRTIATNHDENYANLTVTYSRSEFDVVRTVTLGNTNSSVDITYQITAKNGTTLQECIFNLWALFETALENCQVYQNSTVIIAQGLTPKSGQVTINVLQTDGELEGTRVYFSDPVNSRPVAKYTIKPLQNSLNVNFRVDIKEPPKENSNQTQEEAPTIKFYDSYTLLKDLNIDYILINKYRFEEYQRFIADSQHFSLLFYNKIVAILKVNVA